MVCAARGAQHRGCRRGRPLAAGRPQARKGQSEARKPAARRERDRWPASGGADRDQRMTRLGQKKGSATRLRASRPVSLRASARRTINELIAFIDKRAVAAYASNRMEDWTYAELYVR